MQNLFSYGTLQLQEIQLALFQRILSGTQDRLTGYQKTTLIIPADHDEPAQYPVVDLTGDSDDVVEGVLFAITNDELQKADEYEGDSYQRVIVTLASGQQAWVYVRAVPIAGA